MKSEIPENLKVGDVIVASKLFTSKSEIIRSIKNKGVKINGETVESFDEILEHGDFLNLTFSFPSLMKESLESKTLNTIVVSFGKKQHAVMHVSKDEIKIKDAFKNE